MVAFGFRHWELDSGGPGERAHVERAHPDLLFPQQAIPKWCYLDGGSGPVDDLYLGFSSAIAFSPTDTMPLAPVGQGGHGDRGGGIDRDHRPGDRPSGSTSSADRLVPITREGDAAECLSDGLWVAGPFG